MAGETSRRWQLVALCEEGGKLVRPERPLLITVSPIVVTQSDHPKRGPRKTEVTRIFAACLPHVGACTTADTEEEAVAQLVAALAQAWADPRMRHAVLAAAAGDGWMTP